MYPELNSSKQATWNKCQILWPVCISSKTNRPLWKGERTEITKSMRNKAHYQLVHVVKQSHKNTLNTWKSSSSNLDSLRVTLDICGLLDLFLFSFKVFLTDNFSDLALFNSVTRRGLVFLSVSFNLLLSKLLHTLTQGSYDIWNARKQTHYKYFMSGLLHFFLTFCIMQNKL